MVRHDCLRAFSALLLVLPVLLLTGCERAEISTYYPPKASAVYAGNHVEGPDRMLAALISRPGRIWSFKVAGPKGEIAKVDDAFRSFLASVRFNAENGQPGWTLPGNWSEEYGGGATGMRFATLTLGPGENSLELSVLALPATLTSYQANLLQNVNRWRLQMRLLPIERNQLSEETATLQAGPETVTLVKNLIGHKKAAGPMMAPVAGGGSSRQPARPPRIGLGRPGPGGIPELHHSAPKDWQPGQKSVSRGGITIDRQAAFVLKDDGQQGEVTVTAMPVNPRILLINVNRWRKQVALVAVDADALDDLLEAIPMGDLTGQYLELIGPRETILGTMVEAGGMTWFFKLVGPNRLAYQQRGPFRAFVSSSRFGADAAGGSDGRQ